MRRPHGARIASTFLLSVIVLFSAAASGMTQETTPAALSRQSADLPVTAISLFTSGVGYFQHDGVVSGNADVELVVSADDINDLLKSLVLQDFDGGLVRVVTYPSQDPLSRILDSFSLDIADNPGFAELVNRARGEEVVVDAGSQSRGTIAGVEYRTVRAEAGSEQVAFLNLISDAGISQIAFPDIESLQFTSPALQAELEAALAVIADNRQQGQKTITIEFRGEGERRVRIGYVRAVPVWKTSYRMVLDEDDGAQVQGWAIVENTSEVDWTNVSLGLVSGQPISFVMDLYSPIYRNRPRVANETGVAVAPQVYERDAAPRPDTGAARSFAAPAEAMAFDEELLGNRFEAEPAPIDLSQGVRSAASQESGAIYRISEPVSIPRRGAALIPIVAETAPAERVAIYDSNVLSNRPLAAVRFENATGLQLPAGPATIFDGANYAGDARLPEMIADEERLVSYAVDLATTALRRSTSSPEEITRIRIVNGLLEVTILQRNETSYQFERLDDRSLSHIVIHPRRSGWEIVGDTEPIGETAREYRFSIDVPANGSATLDVAEERVRSTTIGLTGIRDDQIAYYVSQSAIDSRTAAALERIRELRNQVAVREGARREIEQRLSTLYREQERIRSNLEVVDANTPLYERYIDSLTEQEDTIEALQADLIRAREEEESARNALRDYIESL